VTRIRVLRRRIESAARKTARLQRTVEQATEAGDWARFLGTPDFVLSLARGLRVIEAFETNAKGLSVSGVAQRTGLSRAAVRRLLMTLEMLGYAESEGGIYRLKPRILRLGYSYLSSSSLAAIADPILQSVAEILHEAVALGVLEGEDVVYVAHHGVQRVMSVGVSVGTRLPAYCTSGGRVLLAALPEADFQEFLHRSTLRSKTAKTITEKAAFAAMIEKVRLQGFALVDEELEPGLRSMAVPVKSRQNVVVASMNTGVHAAKLSCVDMMNRVLPALKEGAQRLEQQLG
jgi:IclR family transcriptional regulator, pca regulon regulatory protein